MTACEGSCVNGPTIRSNRYENRIRGTVAVNSYAGEDDFGVKADQSIYTEHIAEPVHRRIPDEEEIERILVKLNKNTAETGAELRLLWLSHMPGDGFGAVPGQGRNGHVPALSA